MKRQRMMYLLLIVVVTTMLVMKRFNLAFPDAQQYAIMLDSLLGRGPDVVAESPFLFRILVPILAMPFGLFMASDVALSIVNVIGSVCLAVVMFYICKEFSEYEHDLVAFAVTLVVVGTRTFGTYGASGLTDSVAMLFLASIVLATLRDYDWKWILLLVVVGMLAKELVLFGALFYLLNKRTLQSVFVFMIGFSVMVDIRVLLSGVVHHGLVIHVPQGWVYSTTVESLYLLVGLSALLVVAWVRYSSYVVESLQLLGTGLIAFVPYYLLGVFCAYFDARFVWPLQIVFLGVASVGLGSAYEAFMRRLRE